MSAGVVIASRRGSDCALLAGLSPFLNLSCNVCSVLLPEALRRGAGLRFRSRPSAVNGARLAAGLLLLLPLLLTGAGRAQAQAVAALSLLPAGVTGGTSVTGTVTLSAAATATRSVILSSTN